MHFGHVRYLPLQKDANKTLLNCRISADLRGMQLPLFAHYFLFVIHLLRSSIPFMQLCVTVVSYNVN